MKLTNNLSKEQSFNAYPFTLLHDYRSKYDSIYEGDVRIFKRAHLEGFQVQEMLVRLHEAAKKDESINIYENIDFFSDIYANHWPHRHEIPDPSLLIPFNLSPKRRDYVLEGYRLGIDVSVYANQKMNVNTMFKFKNFLILARQETLDEFNKYSTHNVEVLLHPKKESE